MFLHSLKLLRQRLQPKLKLNMVIAIQELAILVQPKDNGYLAVTNHKLKSRLFQTHPQMTAGWITSSGPTNIIQLKTTHKSKMKETTMKRNYVCCTTYYFFTCLYMFSQKTAH